MYFYLNYYYNIDIQKFKRCNMKNTKLLKNAGIEIISQLSTLEINKIASNISEKICNSFPEHNINKSDLFIALSRLNMYYAKFKDNSAAKYCYKTETIYFKENIDFENLETPAIHECLHFIQTIKNKNGKLLRLGLYTPSFFSESGLALNEAAVQLMASDATKTEFESVKYYGLNITTNSPDYYPIECSLVKQMTYFTGTYPLYHSTLYSDDIFKNTFIMKSNQLTYDKILENLDLIQEYQDSLQKENLYLSYIEYNNENSNKVINSQKKITDLKSSIKDLTLKTQELILTSCTKSDLELVRDNQSVKEFKNKLYNFKSLLIQTENYTFYNEFYCQMMEELDVKRELIKKYGILNAFKDIRENYALIETRQESLNLFKVVINKLKELFKINKEDTIHENDEENN